ncbi:MAG: flavodoxin [Litorilinea sp.]
MNIGLFYGSSTGTTARAAAQIQQTFHAITAHAAAAWSVELLDIAEFYLEEMADFKHLILGIPTWNHGQLQADWELVFEEFDNLDMHGQQVAVFGLGDQLGYPDTFGDALFFLADKVRTRGARLVGAWPTAGYQFNQSWAVEDGRFLGLMLDVDNQPELSEVRIAQWVQQLDREFGIAPDSQPAS